MIYTVTTVKGSHAVTERYAEVRKLLAQFPGARVHAKWGAMCGRCDFCRFKTPREPWMPRHG